MDKRLTDDQLRALMALDEMSADWPPSAYTVRTIVEELLERRASDTAYPSADVLVRIPQEDVNND